MKRVIFLHGVGGTGASMQPIADALGLREDGLSTYRIADELGVSRPAICSVLNRKTWRHVDVRTSNHIS